MAARKSFKLKSGIELPLMDLRGKEYLQVAHRFVWLVDEFENYSINSEFLKLEDEQAVCRTTIKLMDKDGKIIREASATKKETKKDFADFVEKAETGSCGRCLAMLGMGTQFSTQDMEEGQRLADAPLPPPGEQAKADAYQIKESKSEASKVEDKVESKPEVKPERKGFARKSPPAQPAASTPPSNDDGWQ